MTAGGRSLRVAMLIQGYYPHVGGAERQLATLAPALRERGVEVQVLTRRAPGLGSFEEVQGVPVHRLPAPGSRASRSIVFTFAALLRLRRLRPDLLHAHDLYSPATTALLAKRLYGLPVIAKVPRSGHLGDVTRIRGRAFGRRRLAWLSERVDRFVVISDEIDSELAEIGVPEARRVAIPNAVDTERFRPSAPETKAESRASLEIDGGPVVVFTGRLEPEKRLLDLIEIWPRVRERHPQAQLLIVGSGEQGPELERKAGEGVRFPGAALDVAPFLESADLFVLPSSAEGLSNAMLEAMACGLPVVASSVGAAPELIEPGETGWLVPAGEPTALLGAVLAALADPDASSVVGIRARECVESRYSLSVVADRYPELYRELVVR